MSGIVSALSVDKSFNVIIVQKRSSMSTSNYLAKNKLKPLETCFRGIIMALDIYSELEYIYDKPFERTTQGLQGYS